MTRDSLPYRPNVGAILRRSDNLVLMCERLEPRGIWQFPQGGVDPGESHVEALWRELTEEVGLCRPQQVCELVARGPAVNYDFPPDYPDPIAQRYRGQTQTLFLLDFHGTDADFDLQHHVVPEFASFGWYALADAHALLWEFKRGVLTQCIAELKPIFDAGFKRAR